PRPLQRLEGARLQIVEHATVVAHRPAAQRVVEDDRDSARLVTRARASDERLRCCECQEKECGDTKQQEQELTQADLARTLLLGASQVAQGREDHPRALVSLEQMQNDRNDGCCGERQQNRKSTRLNSSHVKI